MIKQKDLLSEQDNYVNIDEKHDLDSIANDIRYNYQEISYEDFTIDNFSEFLAKNKNTDKSYCNEKGLVSLQNGKEEIRKILKKQNVILDLGLFDPMEYYQSKINQEKSALSDVKNLHSNIFGGTYNTTLNDMMNPDYERNFATNPTSIEFYTQNKSRSELDLHEALKTENASFQEINQMIGYADEFYKKMAEQYETYPRDEIVASTPKLGIKTKKILNEEISEFSLNINHNKNYPFNKFDFPENCSWRSITKELDKDSNFYNSKQNYRSNDRKNVDIRSLYRLLQSNVNIRGKNHESPLSIARIREILEESISPTFYNSNKKCLSKSEMNSKNSSSKNITPENKENSSSDRLITPVTINKKTKVKKNQREYNYKVYSGRNDLSNSSAKNSDGETNFQKNAYNKNSMFLSHTNSNDQSKDNLLSNLGKESSNNDKKHPETQVEKYQKIVSALYTIKNMYIGDLVDSNDHKTSCMQHLKRLISTLKLEFCRKFDFDMDVMLNKNKVYQDLRLFTFERKNSLVTKNLSNSIEETSNILSMGKDTKFTLNSKNTSKRSSIKEMKKLNLDSSMNFYEKFVKRSVPPINKLDTATRIEERIEENSSFRESTQRKDRTDRQEVTSNKKDTENQEPFYENIKTKSEDKVTFIMPSRIGTEEPSMIDSKGSGRNYMHQIDGATQTPPLTPPFSKEESFFLKFPNENKDNSNTKSSNSNLSSFLTKNYKHVSPIKQSNGFKKHGKSTNLINDEYYDRKFMPVSKSKLSSESTNVITDKLADTKSRYSNFLTPRRGADDDLSIKRSNINNEDKSEQQAKSSLFNEISEDRLCKTPNELKVEKFLDNVDSQLSNTLMKSQQLLSDVDRKTSNYRDLKSSIYTYTPNKSIATKTLETSAYRQGSISYERHTSILNSQREKNFGSPSHTQDLNSFIENVYKINKKYFN